MTMKRTNAPCVHKTTPTEAYTHLGTYDGSPGYGITQGVEYSLIYCNVSGDVSLLDDRGQWIYIAGNAFNNVKDLSMNAPYTPQYNQQPAAATLVEYLGESDGSAAKDLTIGNTYELDDSFVSVTGKFVKIYRDDAGDPHDVHSHNVRPVRKKKKMKCHAPQPMNPVPDLDDWEDDDFAPDPHDPNHGIEAIVRDVVPEPEGPKSTEDLRAHRYTPDLY